MYESEFKSEHDKGHGSAGPPCALLKFWKVFLPRPLRFKLMNEKVAQLVQGGAAQEAKEADWVPASGSAPCRCGCLVDFFPFLRPKSH